MSFDNEKLKSGSKESLFLPSERVNSKAGFPNEKVGMSEIPLLVVAILPEIWLIKFTLFESCENIVDEIKINSIQSHLIIAIL